MAPKISSISFGSRYCQDYIQEQNEPVIVEPNFKSEINFYEVLGSLNGKMSQKVYIDQVLEPIVMP